MATKDTTSDDEQQPDNTLRRRIVQTFGGLGVVSFAGAMLSPLKTLGIEAQGAAQKIEGQHLVLAEKYQPSGGGKSFDPGTEVTTDMLNTPDSVLVFPKGLDNQHHYIIRLHRLQEKDMAKPTKLEWTVDGYVAYSAICTHLGCTVSWQPENTPTGLPIDHCYCHGSEYNPYEGAKVIRPPAPRALPQIGLTSSSKQGGGGGGGSGNQSSSNSTSTTTTSGGNGGGSNGGGSSGKDYLILTSDFEGPVGPQ